MKIVKFRVQGKESYGLVDGDRIIDAGGELKDRFADVHQVIAADAIDDLKNANGPAYEFSEISFLPPVKNSNAILVVGRNYGTAFAQMDTDFPGYPSIFQRRHSAQVGHLQNIGKTVSYSISGDGTALAT